MVSTDLSCWIIEHRYTEYRGTGSVGPLADAREGGKAGWRYLLQRGTSVSHDKRLAATCEGNMTAFSPWSALAGGALIGLSASLLLLTHGRVAGISGMLGGLLQRATSDRGYRVAFLFGLVAAGALLSFLRPNALPATSELSIRWIVAAGLLVGYGTRLGCGCTSGHGVCGLSRLSPRSMAATLTFMVAGATTVYVVRHLLGGLG
jgi:uncharacterized protein